MSNSKATYHVVTRIIEVAESLWNVSATAFLTTAPRHAVLTRYHECSSREQAVDFLEILLDQVRSAVEATGGEVVSVTSAESLSGAGPSA